MARRNKKVVDYSQFGDANDDDEDFASVTAPSNKKMKSVHSELKKEKKKGSKEEILLKKRSPNKRVSLDDKLFQRHLEVAFALSVNEPTLSNCKVQDSQEQALEGSTNECDMTVGDFSQGAATSKQKLQTEDKNGDSADSYEPETVSIKSRPVLQKASSSSKPIGKPLRTSSPSAAKKPTWIPPAASGSRANQLERVPMTSPSQGLRLGLSRLARVKPLHPSFTST